MLTTGFTVAQLHHLIDEWVQRLTPCPLPLAQVRGLFLAEAIVADTDYPAFHLSAMDGYAVRKDAEPGIFSVIATTLPGQPAAAIPTAHTALRVFTGSALPESVKVIMQEDVLRDGDQIEVTSLAHAGHVRHKGSTAYCGDVLLQSNQLLTPAAIGILSSVGAVTPLVIPRVRVAHLTTGSEIVPTESIPLPGQIRNTNASMIEALVEEAGARYTVHQHCDESLSSCLEITRSPIFAEADLLLVSGGSSGGVHDHTAELLETLGYELLCRKVLCRPGKPLLVGIKGNQVAIGLPGNPVSHFVSFHLFVRRVLERMGGLITQPWMRGTLDAGVALQVGQLETYWPAAWSFSQEGEIILSAKNWLHSGHLTALAGVNALIKVPAKLTAPQAGETVEFLCCGNSAMS